jgi:alginate O-acetyltransferase complex protein AlgI
MLFSSLTFLFVFLPITLLLYYISPKKYRNGLLLFLSIIFFAWGGVSNTIVFIFSIIINFILARKINSSINKKPWLIVGLVFNTALLVVFKYLNFLIENINFLNDFIGSGDSLFISPLKIVLPLGISFYTFHQMSMLWDVYRRPEKIQFQLIESALYVSFFPQLIAGPIVRYKDIIDQIKLRKESMTLFTSGVERFIIGLAKKVILANTAAAVADNIFSYDAFELTTPAAWIGIIAYTLQIYFDFSGYSDMAIGLGRMFGFRIFENFNLPYTAKSIQEFWRRWHISLSTWFRDYVYIPLGGNRISEKRTYLNLLIVFLLTGFWHGATWSFIFWGLFHGFFIVIERLGLNNLLLRIPAVISWGYTLFIVMIGWVFFRVENISDASNFILKMVGVGKNGQLDWNYFLDNENLFILCFSLLLCFNFFISKESKTYIFIQKQLNDFTLLKQTFLICLFLYAVIILNSSSYNPFIYFKF